MERVNTEKFHIVSDTRVCDQCKTRAETRVYYRGDLAVFFNLPLRLQVPESWHYPVAVNYCYRCGLDAEKYGFKTCEIDIPKPIASEVVGD